MKSKEQKQAEKEKKQKEKDEEIKRIRLERELVNALKKIRIFPGSKKEFEDFIGYQTTCVNLGERNLGLLYNEGTNNPFYRYDRDFQKRIVDSGVVALVNANFNYTNPTGTGAGSKTHYYGLPVKRK